MSLGSKICHIKITPPAAKARGRQSPQTGRWVVSPFLALQGENLITSSYSIGHPIHTGKYWNNVMERNLAGGEGFVWVDRLAGTHGSMNMVMFLQKYQALSIRPSWFVQEKEFPCCQKFARWAHAASVMRKDDVTLQWLVKNIHLRQLSERSRVKHWKSPGGGLDGFCCPIVAAPGLSSSVVRSSRGVCGWIRGRFLRRFRSHQTRSLEHSAS